jgi:hypothetical protein
VLAITSASLYGGDYVRRLKTSERATSPEGDCQQQATNCIREFSNRQLIDRASAASRQTLEHGSGELHLLACGISPQYVRGCTRLATRWYFIRLWHPFGHGMNRVHQCIGHVHAYL